ncbi:VOC family protein [Amycolatopsis kentuckyensis]|uniref:VOC family protein n=1 Tax=Amycolatopsis kentuckyensis TaxID=218823 RepID=UPI003568E558
MAIQRMDNVGIVVDDLAAVVALDGVRCDLTVVRTPDGHGRLELMKFHSPASPAAGPAQPVNAFGIRRVMFAVADLDGVLARLRPPGAELLGEVVRYGESHRLAYVRGPEGLIVALAEELG